jgi:ABC-type transport system involved in multi-copper enzyme maturation permease subunit
MKQFRSLLTRDIYLNKWSLLLSPIMVGICYLLILVIDLRWGINLEDISYKMQGANVPFAGLVGVVLGNIWLSGALLSLVVLVILTPNALNDNIKNHCEIFYKCLPIPPWKVVLSKVVSCILLPMAIIFVLAIFNTIVAYLFLGKTSVIELGTLIKFTFSVLVFSLPYTLLFGSFFIFLSGIMKKKVFARFIGVLFGANIAIQIFRSLSGIKIGTLSEYLNRWLFNPSLTGKKIINVDILVNGFMNKMSLDSGVNEISKLVATSVFSWDGFCLVFASLILLTSSVYAYKLRKLD